MLEDQCCGGDCRKNLPEDLHNADGILLPAEGLHQEPSEKSMDEECKAMIPVEANDIPTEEDILKAAVDEVAFPAHLVQKMAEQANAAPNPDEVEMEMHTEIQYTKDGPFVRHIWRPKQKQ